MRRAGVIGAGLVLSLGVLARAAGPALTLTIGDLDAPGFSARGLSAHLQPGQPMTLTVRIGELALGGRTWKNVALSCPRFAATTLRVDCSEGVVDIGERLPVTFSYSSGERRLAVVVQPAGSEQWRMDARLGEDGDMRITVADGDLRRLARWLPADWPQPRSGTASGELHYAEGKADVAVAIRAGAFASADGLQAGEKMDATLDATAARDAAGWRWQGSLAWREGDLYWQPFFFKGEGQRLGAAGRISGRTTTIERARLEWPALGDLDVSGSWTNADLATGDWTLRAPEVALAPFYERILKPLLTPAAGEFSARGRLGLEATFRGGSWESADVRLDDVSVADKAGRYALNGVTARVPWRHDGATRADVAVGQARFYGVSAGPFAAQAALRGRRVSIADVDIPVLDGRLAIRRFATVDSSKGWRWHFAGELTPISMERLTAALGVPPMRGSLSGRIPEVVYADSKLALRGDLRLNVFDGSVIARDVELREPFGRTPSLQATLDARSIDLELLTGRYSFGTIRGRIDAHVQDLQLENWEPVRFDARIASSAGDYTRRISQTAVQNISALGGAGAAAAIQRSFLRFFDEFGYDSIGLSCKLANGICEMGGMEPTAHGYVIVKGSGIPAISVIGYNRRVDWRELTSRLKRITEDNVRAVVK